MNTLAKEVAGNKVSAGCHINDVMNDWLLWFLVSKVSAGCHINDVMNGQLRNF